MKYYVSNVNVISEDIYDVDDFWINVQVDISEKGGAGAEVFSTDLTSPTRISKVCETETLLGHGLIISTSMDLSQIKLIFNRLITSNGMETWDDIVRELGRYFRYVP